MKTSISEDIGQYKDGYMSNICIEGTAAESVSAIQTKLESQLGSSVWLQPLESLHITLFDFIAPKVEYPIPHKQLYDISADDIDEVMVRLASNFKPFTIHITALKSSENAVYLEGYDDGTTARIRNEFLKLYRLDKRTKKPPEIIHSTIARFIENIDTDKVREVVDCQIDEITIPVTSLRLVHERRIPMLEYETLKEYLLQ